MKRDDYIEALGREAVDQVTGFAGIITTVSFDLYGCIQVILTPPIRANGEKQDGAWFDYNRLKINTQRARVLPIPTFSTPDRGPNEKPAHDRTHPA